VHQALKRKGYEVNEKRVRRLMRLMGIEVLYQRPNVSRRNESHELYPYLLRDVVIEKCDQVWSTDITYVRMPQGYMYLVAVIDWYSRYVLSWELSNTLEAGFCV
jgi:putative transposase